MERNIENEIFYSPADKSRAYILPLFVVLAPFLAVVAGYVAASNAPDSARSLSIALLASGLLAAAVATVSFIRHPELGVLVLVFLVYGNLSEIAVRHFSIPSLLQALLAVLLSALFVRCAVFGIEYLKFDVLLLLLLVFIALIFASSVYAADSELTDERLTQYLRGFLLIFVLLNFIRTRGHLRRATWILVAAAAFLSAITILQVTTSSYGFNFSGLARVKNAQIVGNVFEARVSGPLSDPNFYAQILVMVIPFALYKFWNETRLLLKIAAAAALGLILSATAFTFSRSGAVAAAVVMLLAAVHHRIKLRFLAIILAVAFPIYLILPMEFAARLDTLTQVFPGEKTSEVKIDTSFQERALLMETAWEIFKEHPVLGVGAGNYTRYYDQYARRVGSNISSYEGFDKRRYPHSFYLETAAELGVVGLSLLLAIGAVAFYYAVAAARKFSAAGDKYSAGIAAATALSLIGYALTSLFLHGDYLQYLWLIVAFAGAAKQVADAPQAEKKLVTQPGVS